MCLSNKSLFHKKSLNMVSIFYKKYQLTWVHIFQNIQNFQEHLRILKTGPIFWKKKIPRNGYLFLAKMILQNGYGFRDCSSTPPSKSNLCTPQDHILDASGTLPKESAKLDPCFTLSWCHTCIMPVLNAFAQVLNLFMFDWGYSAL